MRREFIAGIVLACGFPGSCAKYQPRALNPAQSETQFRNRTIGGVSLNPDTLTALALRYNSDLAVARAKAAATEAAVITARQRVNPSFSGEGGYNRTPDSLSTYSVSPAFTIETAGKRGFRILAAQKAAEAAGEAVHETEWQVRSSVRTALVAYWAAAQRLKLLQSEKALRTEIAAILEKRVLRGETANPEFAAARAEQALVDVSLRNAEGEANRSLAALAVILGLPAAALEGQSIDCSSFENPAAPDSLSLLSVQQAGLLHRSDVRRSLAEYEAADARLRLELANQYPNISLNPAYSFQEGFPAYTLGSVIDSLPVFHRHQGPIAEAEAERSQVAAQFRAVQAKAIGNTELARRQYASAVSEWMSAKDSLARIQRQRETAVRAAFQAGGSDRLELTQARLFSLMAAQASLDALQRAQTAFGALQDAVEAPLVAGAKH
ncbi:MAG TPA: TolC family protein [Bryobacteraceae bacterium]|nr:TolC family protein [Bryobacteraceae bacterium]